MNAWFDIIIFAVVAFFLILRLRAVLGERHGEEQQRPNPFVLQKPPAPPEHRLPDAAADYTDTPVAPSEAPPPRPSAPPDSLQGRIERLAAADPSFNEKGFLSGARGAFEMIIKAFAAEDTPTLRPLLSDDVYDSFAAAIRARQAAKEKLETKILRIREAELVDVSLVVNTARVTVRFVSEQVQCTRDAAGAVVDGHPGDSRELRDVWTFTRNVRSTDPNWHLCETRSET